MAGIGNSIAAQGIGASASSSISSRFYNVANTTAGTPLTTPATNVINGTDVTANNNGATVTVSANIGTSGTTAQINNGVANFIGASAIGASASAGITQSVSEAIDATGFNMTQLPSNTIIANGTQSGIQAINSGKVIAGINNPGSSEIGLPLAPISSGVNINNVGNSISSQAVGASAAASITSQVFNTTVTSSAAPVAKNSVKFASLSSTNSGAISSTGIFGTSVAAPRSSRSAVASATTSAPRRSVHRARPASTRS